MLDIRKNLADYITDKGIKRVYITRKTGIPESKVGAILNLKRKVDANDFLAICDAIEITPTALREYKSSA